MCLWSSCFFSFLQIPYGDTDDVNIREAVRAGERLEIPADVPKPMAALIERCWAQDATKRPSMREVVNALEPLVPDGPIVSSGDGALSVGDDIRSAAERAAEYALLQMLDFVVHSVFVCSEAALARAASPAAVLEKV